MNKLAVDAGASIGLFVAIGIVFDTTKNLLPAIALKVSKSSLLTALCFGAFALVLSAISVAASISALDSGIDGARKNTAEYAVYSQKINSLESEIKDLKDLAHQQKLVGQVTNSAKTLMLVSTKNTALSNLLNAQTNLKPSNNLLVKFGQTISITVAVALELITLVLTVALHYLTPKTPSASQQNTSMHFDTTSASNPAMTRSAPANALALQHTTHTPIMHTPEIFVAKTNAQLYAEVKAAVITGTVKPSYRSIQSIFKIKQEQVKVIQESLLKEGLLEPWNNGGYRLKLA